MVACEDKTCKVYEFIIHDLKYKRFVQQRETIPKKAIGNSVSIFSILTFRDHNGPIIGVDWKSDTLVTCSTDHTILVYKARFEDNCNFVKKLKISITINTNLVRFHEGLRFIHLDEMVLPEHVQ